jgi:hypothetical protein
VGRAETDVQSRSVDDPTALAAASRVTSSSLDLQQVLSTMVAQADLGLVPLLSDKRRRSVPRAITSQ